MLSDTQPDPTLPSVAEYSAETEPCPLSLPPYVDALVSEGPGAFIHNANVQVKALVVGESVVPLAVCEPREADSCVCSPSAHYVRYTHEEIVKRNSWLLAGGFHLVFSTLGLLMRSCQLDRVVYVNNWFYSTNPPSGLDSAQVQALTGYLKDRYPAHAIVHRTVNPNLNQAFYDHLVQAGYRMVKSRRVMLLDPASPHVCKRTNVKQDLRLLRDSDYELIDETELSERDLPRLKELYSSLYLDKHSRTNAQLTERFFGLTLGSGTLSYRALRRDGRIDGFASFYVQDSTLSGVCIGYDASLPQELALFRQVIAILISEATRRGVLLNLSSGANEFKILRGALPTVEFDAVFDRHLAPKRRLAWKLTELQGRAWGKPRGLRTAR